MSARSATMRVLILALPLLGAGSGDVQVAIDNFSFSGAAVAVGVGTKVVWTNRDDIPHTVTGLSGAGFRSGALDTGDSFAFVFTQAGTFQYFCSLHPRMRGTVVVR